MLSVTQILEPFTDFSMVSEDVLIRATERGDRVHRNCACISSGGFPMILDEDAGYIDSFLKWFSLVDEVLAVEREFVSEAHQFLGHPDLIVKIGEKTVLVDLKTPITKYRTWRGQLAAYWLLATEEFHINYAETLQLRPDGKHPKAEVLSLADYPVALSAFHSALNAYRYFKYFRGD